jgi:hypothetical protein
MVDCAHRDPGLSIRKGLLICKPTSENLMINVMIGNTERALSEASPEWIHQQVHRRHSDGSPVCIRVRIDEPNAVMVLTTQDCPRGASNSRGPNALEQRIFDLWKHYQLDEAGFNGGQFAAFIERLRTLL